MKTMRAARLHEAGGAFCVDTIPVPEPEAHDVLIRVAVCGIVPNLKNVISNYGKRHPSLPSRKLPAVYGLDAVGVIDTVGSAVQTTLVGKRVYVNPALGCGNCFACRRGDLLACPDFTFHGYFGFGAGSNAVFERYPYGGFSEYLTAPTSNLVMLDDQVSDEAAARFGYLGTAYSALLKAGFGPGKTVLIDGITGTLGVGAALVALAMGAAKVFGTGRDREMLERVKSLDPGRIITLTLGEEAVQTEVLQRTGGLGVDAAISTLGPGAPANYALDALSALRRGGVMVGCGGLAEPIRMDPLLFMRRQLQYKGSLWFTTGEAETLQAMAASGLLDLSVFEHEHVPLESINDALNAVDRRKGGFTNIVIAHQAVRGH